MQPLGYVAERLEKGTGEIEAEIDMDFLWHQRESFTALKDADKFELI